MKHFLALSLALVLAMSVQISAQTIGVILVQDEAIDSARSLVLSEAILGGALDGLFQAGYIGTNLRPVLGSRQDWLDVVPDYYTLAGYVDYLVIFYASYEPAAVLQAPGLEYRIMAVNSREILREGRLEAVAAIGQNEAAIEKACTDSGATLILAGLAGLDL
ncbi:MAG: hypothetical protein A2087_14780 [Spirochaetes bacterium GWD1_61_31]|nr:MAG: hypothetical protein A2Y37_12875 [Spirochaetes bacterium GWB1_60_80]OHD28676.1 MAG: hypothetical protein A2004_05825 [Spirochaetes bacterium GWC1_61_12]OHD38902.1 MAG: hypothetical protein A2087_14780 [Spirochaetes bacterium GWD1_61_31]OHD43319.1 MAG: hypothetical protein A2Y35_08570 [Spirochaetes bacterium GWE1_60_18]OHD58857.1 MAG: hypothetical protein A2Y32_08940 [Spirochaetes bacterium GWF1_60_12]HAP42511.1 hypothetical protein [Spirochaetaceae bacterium]